MIGKLKKKLLISLVGILLAIVSILVPPKVAEKINQIKKIIEDSHIHEVILETE